MQAVEPADRAQRQRQRDGEAASFTVSCTTLTTADDLQPAGGEIDRDDERADRAAGGLRDADHDVQDPGDADQLAGEDADRADPQQRRDGRAHAAVVAPLEEVADGPQIVLGGEPADARAQPRAPGRAIRAPRIRPTTPPRGRRDSRARSAPIVEPAPMFAASNVANIRPGPSARPATKKSLDPFSRRATHTPSAICASE